MTAFERIVLVYPDISFTLYSNQQELLNLRAGSLRQRLVDVFGKKLSQELLPLQVDTALCRISGFVGKPESARRKGAHAFFFVNGRFMRHPYFHKAVVGAYERLVPEGMQAPYFVYFDVAPADIDVNIHPTKTEIKFENEQGIFQILAAAVKDALGRFCDVPSIDFDTEGRPEFPVFDPQGEAVGPPQVQYNPAYTPRFPSAGGAGRHAAADMADLYAATLSQPSLQPSLPFPADDDADAPPAAQQLAERSPQHYQYKGRYIMTAVKSGLMIIDQHRADVRICYERNLQRISAKAASTQRVLFPEVLQFSPSDAVMLQRLLPDLSAMGFDVSDLGGGSFVVNGIPAGIDGIDPLSLLRNIVTDAVEQSAAAASNFHSALALSMARNTAVPYGQVLSNEEMERIVNELFACSNANYTPDGNPILAILPQGDIEQLLS